MKTSDAQKEATKKYLKTLKPITIRVKEDDYEQIKEQAAKKSSSMRAYILGLIKKDMESEN